MQINDLLKISVKKKASDIYIIANTKPIIRVDGKLSEVAGVKKLTAKEAKDLVFSVLNKKEQADFKSLKDVDISYEVSGVSRFRINLHWEKGNPALSARVIARDIPTMEEILMPEAAYNFTRREGGLIIITSPTGNGKSTTMAAMVGLINKEKRNHIITLEDPIEFLYKNDQSILEQRELGKDFNTFQDGLKHVLRQDPDVIMVGEMRDLESIASTLTLAETGHLVFATLHTPSASQTIDRIIDVFPPHQQNQIRLQLSTTLAGIISQKLLPKKEGGRIVAREVLINNSAIANLIREQKTHQIENVVATSLKEGMSTMEQDIKRLFKEELIEENVAQSHLEKRRLF